MRTDPRLGAILAATICSTGTNYVDIFDAPPRRSRKYRPPGTTKSVETAEERKRRRKLERQRRKAGRNQR